MICTNRRPGLSRFFVTRKNVAFSHDDSVRKVAASLPPEQINAALNAVTDYVGKLPAASGK
jgi:hypothetical protein